MNALVSSLKGLKLLNVTKYVVENSLKNVEVAASLKSNKLRCKGDSYPIVFNPRHIEISFPKTNLVKRDPLSRIPIINPIVVPATSDQDVSTKIELDLPAISNEEIQAARLIVIRRKKMKKHQRRKLWKRMRHRWAKVKQSRRQRKERIFQGELLAMVKEAESFSAEQYVADKLAKANYTPLPTRWKGKKLPAFIIRQLMGLDKKINYKHTDVYKA